MGCMKQILLFRMTKFWLVFHDSRSFYPKSHQYNSNIKDKHVKIFIISQHCVYFQMDAVNGKFQNPILMWLLDSYQSNMILQYFISKLPLVQRNDPQGLMELSSMWPNVFMNHAGRCPHHELPCPYYMCWCKIHIKKLTHVLMQDPY